LAAALLPIGCAVAATLTAGAGSAPGRAVLTRPNIIVVMTDDQTTAELRGMRATRRLIARQGVSFSRFYVSYPVCCPSRATYLTGQYAHNHGVMGLYPPTGGYGRFDKRNALPVWLQRAGYHTAHFGKFLNGYGDRIGADVPPGWSDWHATVDYSTYRMWGYTINDNGRVRTYGRPFELDPGLYQTDLLAAKAQAMIDRHAGRRPLFISLNFLAPHHEDRRVQARSGQLVRPAPRHLVASTSRRLPRTPDFNERDMSDKPRFLRRRTAPLDARDIARLEQDARNRRASLLAVDEAVARIVRALRRSGQLDNTYILFTSDNGYMQGQHRVRSGKMLPYDPATRVPLLMRGPELPRGVRSGELTANIDLAPTVLDIAGAEAREPIDGRSLLPFARRPKRSTDRPILHETGGSRSVGLHQQDESPNAGRSLRRVLTYHAVRTRRWLYVRYRDGSRELYDMRHDPYQLRSLHAHPRYRATRRALSRELRRLVRCRGEYCRAPGRKLSALRGSLIRTAKATLATRRRAATNTGS
jgi:N-acetylglucosamine-6-sulfatase